jgi:radical SAM superfamily enzyme YgiQ (UPF0313 family)
MVEAGFRGVFLGIETPSLEGLRETGKVQNTRGSLLDSVRTIQRAGMVVHGGFIVGFDSDGEDIFDRQIDFIRSAAIPNAFVELLSAFPGTGLYERMKREGRLKQDVEGTLGDGTTNIRTVLPERRLLEGYRDMLAALYRPEAYFERALEQFSRLPRPPSLQAGFRNLLLLGPLALGLFRPRRKRAGRPRSSLAGQVKALARFARGLPPAYSRQALRFLLAVTGRLPERLPGAILFLFTGAHFYRYTYEHMIPKIDARIQGLPPS